MIIQRFNPRGLQYQIKQLDEDTTQIFYKDKSIVVHFPIELINQAWFCWQNRGDFVQHAFSFLTSGEREFLLTGLTEEEFDELFKEEGE